MNAPRLSRSLLVLAAFLLAATGAFASDLTGCWDNTGVTPADTGFCYFRQTVDSAKNDLLLWSCRQTGQANPAWSNLAFGTIHKDGTIGINWADDPQGQNRGSGTLTLKINSDSQVSYVASAGSYFGSRTWKRRASCPNS